MTALPFQPWEADSRPSHPSEFTRKIEQEFCQGSAIAPELFRAAVKVVSDIEIEPGGEVSAPIHEALNWRYTRFGYQANDSMQAALLLQESGECWQAKLSRPRKDKDGKTQRYTSPVGNGSRAFLPAIPLKVWKKIAARNNIPLEAPWLSKQAQQRAQSRENSSLDGAKLSNDLEVGDRTKSKCLDTQKPIFTGFAKNSKTNIRLSALRCCCELAELDLEELRLALESAPADLRVPDFWLFIEQRPEIQILFTEGGKKALSLLTLGYVAIALYGVNGGYNNVAGVRSLIPDVQRFAAGNRKVMLAFDQDAEARKRRRVNIALARFGGLLAQAECDVSIASWNGSQGKGVDDLIVACGAEAWDRAYSEALPLKHWQIWQRLENRLTYPAQLRLTTADLSTLKLDSLPERGIIAIASAKGTGKTKFIAKTVAASSKVLAGGHRIALMKNLCERIKLDYRGDLDRVKGQLISGAGYSLRVGFCVDSLLAIAPESFRDCDLVLDEVTQVVRHLLTSSTCNKEGMRPLLLARFTELVKVARRLIVADADLDNATLHYLRSLRGDDAPAFLIRNDHQAAGYAVRFVESSDRSGIMGDLLNDVGTLPQGKLLFVSTDSKRLSNTIAHTIEQQHPGKRVLVLNSDTSGGECEQAFIKNPDAELHHYDVVIASPTLATGVSIETRGIVLRVYGIFTGGSSTDADIAQALNRVREPVERIVWCAKRGSNFSKVSKSSNPLELKNHLHQQTSVAASLVKLSLQSSTQSAIAAYGWAADVHLNQWAQFTAEQNRSMHNLRDALLIRLRHEGHRVTVQTRSADPAMKLLLRASRDELKQVEAEAIANAEELSYCEIALLESKESQTPEDRLVVANFHLRDFYGIQTLTVEDVLSDRDGRYRGELLNLEAQLYPDVAVDRTARELEKQASWNQGLCPWDIPGYAVRQLLREKIGLDDFLTTAGRDWSQADYKPYADRARGIAPQIKVVLSFTIKPEMSDAQIINQLLSQMGVGMERKQRRIDGKRASFYRLNQERYQDAIAILNRRKQQRESIQQREDEGVTPPAFYIQNRGGVTDKDPPIPDSGGIAAAALPAEGFKVGDRIRYIGPVGPLGRVCESKVLTIVGIDDTGIAEISHDRWLVRQRCHVSDLATAAS